MGIRQISYMLKWSKPYIRKYKFYLIFLIFLILVSVGLSLIQVNFVQRSIDAVLVREWQLLVQIFLFFVGISVLKIFHGYIYGHYSNYVSVNVTKDAKEKYTQAILNAQMYQIRKESSGDLNTKHNKDIPVALGFIQEVYANFLLNPLMAIGSFIYLLFFSWQLSLFVFLPIPILLLLLNYLSNRASRIYRALMELRGDYTEEVYDIAHGIETIKAYNMQGYKLNKVIRVLKNVFTGEVGYSKNDAITVALIMVVGYLPHVIALTYGGMLVVNGELSVSVLFAYSLLISKVNTPTINLFSSLRSIKNSYQSMKRLDSIFNIEYERQDGQIFTNTGSQSIIQFEHVEFSYDQKNKVLKDVNLELHSGKCIGIVGDSGAGKSTIVNLICGFYQIDSGKISIFDEDISAWNLDALRSNIAYVSQDTNILPGTIFENIQYGRLESSREEVYDAAQKAGLSDFINSLPSGFDMVLSEDGGNLSGGQRQRISLARAYLKKASIYILDEPTAALDPAAESFVMGSIREIVKDKSVIVISHNLKTLEICDDIYLIKDGVVLEKGTIDELLVNRKHYYDLFKYHLEAEQ